jgi:outer membrane protein TolC
LLVLLSLRTSAAAEPPSAGAEATVVTKSSLGVSGTVAPLGEGVAPLAKPGPVTLDSFLERFVHVDSSIPVAEHERAVAELRAELSDNRLRLYGEADAPLLGYDRMWLAGTHTWLGDAAVSSAGVRMEDPFGGRFNARLSGRYVSHPERTVNGHTAGAEVSYRLPLGRNLLGRLYELETLSLRQEADTAGANVVAERLARCAVGLELYASAWVWQEQAGVWKELLDTKKKTADRTQRDYARRMVTALDSLTTHSDWLASQQRFAAFDGQRRRALEVVGTYLGADASALTLDSPAAFLDATPDAADAARLDALLAEHPAVVALDHARDAYAARSALVARQYATEVAVGPTVGVDYASRIGATSAFAGANANITRFYALLGVQVELPLIEPAPDVETAVLHHRMQQVVARRRETLRALRERVLGTLQELQAVEEQLALTEEKLATIKKQIGEAASMYQNGRLEFQDFLQHWAFYEEARFEHSDLLLVRWRGRIQLLSVLGPMPKACGDT